MRFSRELSQDEMDELKEIHNSHLIVKRFFEIALIDIGSTWDAEDSIDPKEFQIPEEQWKDIAVHLVTFDGQWTWMNIGPSVIHD